MGRFPFLLLLSDGIGLSLALLGAYWLRFESGWIPAPKGIPPFSAYLRAWPAILLVAWAVFAWMGTYRPTKRLPPPDEFYEVLIGLSLTAVLLMALSFLYRDFEYSRLTLALAWGLGVVTVTGGRLWVRSRWAPPPFRLGAVGSSWLVEHLERYRHRLAQQNYCPTALWTWPGPPGPLEAALERGEVDLLLVEREVVPEEVWARWQGLCVQKGIRFAVVPKATDLMLWRGEAWELAGLSLWEMRPDPQSGLPGALKRGMDVALAGLGLLFLGLPMLLIALLIRLTSPGPVLLRQERVTKGGKVFPMYKFRTMIPDAEKETGPVWAQPHDPRVTPLGRWLRRTSLDELPQLLNVLKGEMSIVGPRPERPYFVEQFRRQIPRYDERHRVKAGMTGWAQAHGLRGNCSVEERLRYDLYYVENWSLLLDLRILVKTLFEFLFHRSAI